MLNTIKMSEYLDLNELWRYLDSGILPLLFVLKASNVELLFALGGVHKVRMHRGGGGPKAYVEREVA